MNSLTLLDSFLSRSLSATRPPSPPDTPHASSSSRRRSRPPSTTPLGSPGQEDHREDHRDNEDQEQRRPSRSASMPRRASDYALQTSRNRIKRSDRMALGLAMTSSSSAVADDSDQQRESDEEKRRRRSERRQEKRAAREERDPTDGRYTHGKYYSEGQSQSTSSRHPLRRADSSPADASARWGSSLWGLGSWLDLPASSSSTSRQPRRRKRSSTKGSKDWDYPPGDRLDDQQPKDKEESSSSDDSDSSTGSGSSTSSQGGSEPYPHAGPELSGRLLFANRIFTPFHHPSLTASVPNLPSEMGTTGLGGMEDVDTVDFEGGESDSDDEQRVTTGDVAPAQDAPAQQEPRPVPTTPTRTAKRSATVTPIVTPKASRSSSAEVEDDYFGPRAVHQERKRQRRESSKAATTAVGDDQAQVDNPVTPTPDTKMDTEAQSQTDDTATLADDQTSVHTKAETLATTTSTETLVEPTPHDEPPPYEDATCEELAKAESAGSDAPPPRRVSGRPSWVRRMLSFIRRAILAILMAPIEAVTFVCQIGRGKRRQMVQVRIDAARTPVKSSTTSTTGGDSENENDDDVVTEEQAQQRAEERAARRKKMEEVKASETTGEKRQASKAEENTPSEKQEPSAPDSPPPAMGRKQSRLLPNPHPVDPMLVHDKRAKKVTGELPAELVLKRERGGSLGLMDKKTAEALVGRGDSRGEKSESGTPLGATSPSSPPAGPRSAVIHHTPKILVLDLDETLIHSTSRSPTWTALRAQHSRTEAAKHAVSTGGSLLGLEGLGGLLGLTGSSQGRSVRPHMVEVVLGGRSVIYHVYKRPWVDYFLRKVSAWYHVVVFTASVQEYADPVIDWLDQGRGLIAGRLFRDACTYKNGSYLKDLEIVDVDLSRVCLVDNSPASYYLNPSNGIPIEGWTHDPDDEALLDLLPILDSLRFAQDVRHVLGLRITERR